MTPPDHVRKRAANLGIEIVAWDEQRGAVQTSNPWRAYPYSAGPMFTGTHAEVVAYLQAWEHLRAERYEEQETGIKVSMLAVSSGVYVMPGTTAIITTRSLSAFRGRRLAIPDDIARHFVVNDIRVGMLSQFSSYTPVPGEALAVKIQGMTVFELSERTPRAIAVQIASPAKEEFGMPLTMTTCQPGQDIAVTVTHNQAAPGEPDFGHVFQMLILGEQAYARLPSQDETGEPEA